MARDKFITELNQIGYYRLDASTPGGKALVIILLALKGKYTEHGPQLRGLIASLNSEKFARQTRFEEVIVIAPEDVMAKKNMTDVVLAFQQAAGGKTALAEYYNMYPYRVFSVDIPRVRAIPHHAVAESEEVQKFLDRERRTVGDLREIFVTDPPLIWIGARPRQVVRISAPSETAGEAHTYCHVRGPKS